MNNLIISSSILSADFCNLGSEIRQVEQAGGDWIHVDVMDGHFTPNITMGPFIVEHCRKNTTLPVDVHLMIEKPERFVDSFIQAGATYLSLHLEGNPLIIRTLQSIRKQNCHPGIALAPATPSAHLEYLLPHVDYVLVMTVDPGFSGQAFQKDMIRKVQEIKHMIQVQGLTTKIQVDGGINAQTLPAIYAAGAEIAVAASAIFRHQNGIAAGIQALRTAIQS